MTDRECLEQIYALAGAQLGQQPPEPPEPPVTSPTGREPRLMWTPHLQRTYNRMREEAGAGLKTLGATIYNQVISASNGNRYGDYGLWGTLAFQMTGDARHAANAWGKLAGFIASTATNDNTVREYGLERVICLDWLYPALTEEQRQSFFAAIDRMVVDGTTNTSLPATMPIRIGDSDQVTGSYFLIAGYAAAFGEEHPAAMEYFNKPYVGGYDATGTDRTTLRNAISDWATNLGEGGEWVEGAEYNLGTFRLLAMGWKALRTALGVEHCPDIVAFMTETASRCAHMLSPDRRQPFQWGDIQDAHRIVPEDYTAYAMMIDDPRARQFVYEMWAQYPDRALEMWAKPKLMFDPYGPVAPIADLPPQFQGLAGMGVYTARTGWATDASTFFAHFLPTHPGGGVDHVPTYYADVQLYRKGHWGLTHPIAYGGPLDLINGVLCAGFAKPREWTGAAKGYRGPGWEFVGGTCGGSVQSFTSYRMAAVYWQEFSRQILWLQGAHVDTVIVFDRTDLLDPQTMTGWNGLDAYSAPDKKRITSNPLRGWRWHMPVVPILMPHGAEWGIPDSDEVARVTWLRDDFTTTVVDERECWPNGNVTASEKKYHTLHVPPSTPGFETTLFVFEAGDPAHFATITAVDEHDDLCGVTLVRAGEPDCYAFFHTTPGAPLGDPTKASYHPDNPALLAPKRIRTTPVPAPPPGAVVFWPETVLGVAQVTPSAYSDEYIRERIDRLVRDEPPAEDEAR